MRTHRLGQVTALLAALATVAASGCGAGRASPPPTVGTIEARVAAAPLTVKAILVAVGGAGIASPMTATLAGDQNGHWSGRVLNVPPGTLRTVTAYAYDTLTVPLDPEADTAGLVYKGTTTNVTVTAGVLTGVTVPLLPWPDGGGGFGLNTPPHITSVTHAASMAADATATFTATAIDPDSGAMLTYWWTDTAGGTFSGGDVLAPDTFSNQLPGDPVSVGYTPPAGYVGTTTVRVTVFDGTATATTTFPIGVGSGIDVGLVFDVLPEIRFLAASSQELLQGGTSVVDWTLAYPLGAGPDAPTTLDVTTAWTDSCGGGFSPATGAFTVVDGLPVGTQQVTYTAPVTGDPAVAQCDLTLTVTDLHGAEVFSKVVVWVNPGVAPALPGKVVFLSSTTVQGGTFAGSSAAADAFCQARADAGAVPAGTYRAFLSIGGVDAASRVADAAYALPDGTPVAASKADLLDGTLLHAIDMDETGLGGITVDVWTGSTSAGALDTLLTQCFDWTSSSNLDHQGSAGSSAVTTAEWALTDWSHTAPYWCGDAKPVYCFQQ